MNGYFSRYSPDKLETLNEFKSIFHGLNSIQSLQWTQSNIDKFTAYSRENGTDEKCISVYMAFCQSTAKQSAGRQFSNPNHLWEPYVGNHELQTGSRLRRCMLLKKTRFQPVCRRADKAARSANPNLQIPPPSPLCICEGYGGPSETPLLRLAG